MGSLVFCRAHIVWLRPGPIVCAVVAETPVDEPMEGGQRVEKNSKEALTRTIWYEVMKLDVGVVYTRSD